MVIITVPDEFITQYEIKRMVSLWENQLLDAQKWVNESGIYNALTPILCGFAVAIFSLVLVFLDSNIPGVEPLPPFSPQSRRKYQEQRGSTMHLSYLTALLAGVTVATILYLEL